MLNGHTFPRLDLSTTHEEADIIIAQQAIHISKEDPQSKVRVVSDDTDVFALLVYFYSTECLQTSTTMQSPVQGCCCIDVRETAKNIQQLHQNCSPFTHCKPMTQSQPLMVLAKQQQLKGFKLDKLGSTTVDVSELLSQATAFMAACYGEGKGCSSMTECRQRLWA